MEGKKPMRRDVAAEQCERWKVVLEAEYPKSDGRGLEKAKGS